ncbi:MAG: 2-hydroxychromene-2-carboxylate isomerase [Pseudomonadota bacterium]
MRASIDYYFALQSPWSYLGLERLRSFAERSGSAINYKPMKLATIFGETGGLPLAKRSKERQAYRMMELERWRFFLDVPLKLEPKVFPVDETLAAHTVLAALDGGAKEIGDLCEAFHAVVWTRDEDLSDVAVVRSAVERAGFDVSLVDTAKGADLDAVYEAHTRDAIAAGVFGAPSYVIEGEVFWGQDRLDFVGRKLGLRH